MQSTRPQKIKMFCSLRQSHNSASPDSLNLKFLRDPWTRYLELVNNVISKLFQLSECQFQMTVKPGSSTRGELDTSLSWWSSPLPPSSPRPSIIRLFFLLRGVGLSLKDKYGDVQPLSTASVGCVAPIISSDHTNAGYVWMVNMI